MPEQTENKQVTRQLLEVFEHGRLEAIDALVGVDVSVFLNHVTPDAGHG